MMESDHAFIGPIAQNSSAAITVGVKDIIDVAGVVTTAGSELFARDRPVAGSDAECLAPVRAAGAFIVGKTNLHQLAFGTTGEVSSYGIPRNPLDPALIPGGSSSGSAVAVAAGTCDVALGTDTGGSVRIPSACCGTVGLKTTYGLISTIGVWPLAPSLDTVGPMARTVSLVARGMELLQPGFEPSPYDRRTVGRLRVPAHSAVVDEAVDAALAASGLRSVDVGISTSDWDDALDALDDLLAAEAAQSNLSLRDAWDELGVGHELRKGEEILADDRRVAKARKRKAAWSERLQELSELHGAIAMPTLERLPPKLRRYRSSEGKLARYTGPINLAGLPAIVLPVPAAARVPASVQLVGPANSEDVLVGAATRIESALAGMRT